MAAQTPTSLKAMASGSDRLLLATMPALSNNDTWATNLVQIDSVQICQIGGTLLTDAIDVASVSGGTITFAVAGTARTAYVNVYGR